ncbi:MAG: YggS family pyridoxal phosphate-dependent enzyme [Pyrinomonadaceae bacterium]|nr:YggS family pyridoxal phosphate-dependent enzyme [Pyrinomonadaceae bacterium]MCX7640409.1 YggS family pyridoxal phosphate-dependent enzyme [Pyrinomonadaceae bacterium]MDW8304836.1 YggS family pyridoxal phosphate-dependent enzyme [Acidobacteriota bacterium]
MHLLKANIEKIRNEIEETCRSCGRKPEEVVVVAVSKSQPVALIEEAIKAGIKIFGENRVQEAEKKIALLGHQIEWHLVGHLQSNKVKKAVRLFDVIHSVDSIKIARLLNQTCKEENRAQLPIFIQVNISGEKTKSGVSENDLEELVDFVRKCDKLKPIGLMTLPPFFEDAEKVRPFFRRLKFLRDKFLPNGGLSMGMSHDFHIAIQEGATHVRIGTKIFGERK